MVQSVDRAIRLLEALDGGASAGAPLGELAERTGLKPPTAHSLLGTLVALGYANHDPASRLYSLGAKAAALGRRQSVAATLAQVGHPVLSDLSREFGETVLIALFRDGFRHTIATVESDRTLRVGGKPGVDSAFYGTATGRVLLSLLSSARLRQFVGGNGLPGTLWPEVRDEAGLVDALAEIRSARFVLYKRPQGDVCAAAVPVPVAEPGACASVGMYFPAVRPPAGGRERLKSRLTEAAVAIAAGYELQV